MNTQAENEGYDAKIDAFITRNSKSLGSLKEKVHRSKVLKIEKVEAIIFLFYLISESYGRSCAVYSLHMANYLENPSVLHRLKTFQPHSVGRGTNPHAPKYLLNFIVLRQILRRKKILNAGGLKKIEVMRDERKKLIRYISDKLEDTNFLRGYTVIRYIKANDRILLDILKTILLKTVTADGNPLFTEADIAPYFDQQKNGEMTDIADPFYIRNLRAELVSEIGLTALNDCCNEFEAIWKIALLNL